MNEFYVRKSCRLCNSSDLDLVLSLKKSPLCDAYVKEQIEQKFYDLDVFLCTNCRFVQISTIINPEYIYKNYCKDQILNGQVPLYPPTSGHSSGLKDHFIKYAEDVNKYLNINNYNLIIDVGSSDGILLNCLKFKSKKVLGIEASLETAKKANLNGIETFPEFLNKKLAKKIVNQFGHADLITINNLFANIDELEEFMKGIESLLGREGILIIESSYLLDMIKNMVFDYIYHEHLSYLSILPLVKFFKKFKMRLIRVQELTTKGGSMRYFWAREGSKWSVEKNVDRLTKKEKKAKISKNTFKLFKSRIDEAKKELFNFLQDKKDLKIIGYGASATSTILISHFHLNHYIEYLVDDNPMKIGTYSPGYLLPVFSPEKLFYDSPDIIIILAWRFKEVIQRKLTGIKSQMIVPLPKFEVL